MKKGLIALVILAVIGAGGYGVYHHFFANTGGSAERVSSSSEDAVYVDSVSSITGYGSGTGLNERYSGEVEAQATLEVKLDSDRTLDECFVEEGDEVEAGQKLFSYDTQDDEDKIAEAQIEIERAQAEIEIAKDAVTQAEKSKASASADDQLDYSIEIASQQNTIKTNEYNIKSKQLEIEKLQANIDDSVVTAEMSGIVQKISDPGSNTDTYSYSSDSSAYITILADGDFRIKGTVNEQNYSNLSEGLPMIVHSRVDSGKSWTGVISEIKTEQDSENSDGYYYYSSGTADSSSYTFYVTLDSSEGLMLGQHVYMEVDAGQNDQKEGLWLPEYYILQEDDGKSYVWMADASNLIEKHEITLGEYDADLMEYEVTGGLELDDYIAYPMDGISVGNPVVYNDLPVEGGDEDYASQDYEGQEPDGEEDNYEDSYGDPGVYGEPQDGYIEGE